MNVARAFSSHLWAMVFDESRAQVRLVETGSNLTEWIALQAPSSVATNFTWTLPAGDGSANQCLATNGSGALIWRTSASANSLDASDGSPTNALFVDANGNVGIGTTAPGNLLEINKNQNSTTAAAVVNANAGTSANSSFALSNGTDVAGMYLYGTGAGRYYQVAQTGPGGMLIDIVNSTGNINFRTGATPTEKMTIFERR